MIIRSPTDYIAYWTALAKQHPEVAHVVHGEMSRPEAGTTSLNQYPLVLIEWPSVKSPRSEQPLKMSGRIYVISTAPDGAYADEDITSSVTYRIAYNLVAVVQAHSHDDAYTFTLSTDELTIDPVEYIGSDQQRGWMFQVEFEVDQSLCKDNPFDSADFFMPQFSWENRIDDEEPAPNAQLSFENLSVLSDLGDSYGDQVWYWQEDIAQAEPTEFDAEEGIVMMPVEDGPSVRIIHVWLRSPGPVEGQYFWAYARIDSRHTSGNSIPFVPFYPN